MTESESDRSVPTVPSPPTSDVLGVTGATGGTLSLTSLVQAQQVDRALGLPSPTGRDDPGQGHSVASAAGATALPTSGMDTGLGAGRSDLIQPAAPTSSCLDATHQSHLRPGSARHSALQTSPIPQPQAACNVVDVVTYVKSGPSTVTVMATVGAGEPLNLTEQSDVTEPSHMELPRDHERSPVQAQQVSGLSAGLSGHQRRQNGDVTRTPRNNDGTLVQAAVEHHGPHDHQSRGPVSVSDDCSTLMPSYMLEQERREQTGEPPPSRQPVVEAGTDVIPVAEEVHRNGPSHDDVLVPSETRPYQRTEVTADDIPNYPVQPAEEEFHMLNNNKTKCITLIPLSRQTPFQFVDDLPNLVVSNRTATYSTQRTNNVASFNEASYASSESDATGMSASSTANHDSPRAIPPPVVTNHYYYFFGDHRVFHFTVPPPARSADENRRDVPPDPVATEPTQEDETAEERDV